MMQAVKQLIICRFGGHGGGLDFEELKKKEDKKVIVNQPRRAGKNSGYANRQMTPKQSTKYYVRNH